MTPQSIDIRDGSEHVGQVSRCLMVKTPAYIHADFEADSLLDRQPVQLVTNVNEVIKFKKFGTRVILWILGEVIS